MSEAVSLFRNRMGASNWALIVLGFVLAAVLLLVQGADALFVLSICGGLALLAVLVVFAAVTRMGRTHVAELTRRGANLQAEMLSPTGKGRIVPMALAEVRDWRITRLWPSIRFRHAGRDFVMPLAGARVDWPALREAAPGLREVVR
jgi:hypothetical protein